MFDLFIIALLQFATLTDSGSANKIGSSGWDNDYTGANKSATSTNSIGSSGWDNDYTGANKSATSANKIGSSGWDNDYTGK
jgi:hypothetical protein